MPETSSAGEQPMRYIDSVVHHLNTEFTKGSPRTDALPEQPKVIEPIRGTDIDAFGRTIENPELHKAQGELVGKLQDRMVEFENKLKDLHISTTVLNDLKSDLRAVRALLNDSNPQRNRQEEINDASAILSILEDKFRNLATLH